MFNEIDNLGLFIVAGVLLNLTPGPDVLYIVSNGLKRGWPAGAVAALGITAGCFVHVGAAALGLSALMAASSMAFGVLKWLGAAYLIYVGLGMLGLGFGAKAKSPVSALAESTDVQQARAKVNLEQSLTNVLLKGFWTNVLNPKVALFFLAFVPQFIAPGATHQALDFFLLGLLFNFNSLWINLGYAALAAFVAQRLTLVQRAMHWLERVAGVLFISFGLKLALTDNPTTLQ
jgi:threonine/homoserine/homoserine lactone efflux protein